MLCVAAALVVASPVCAQLQLPKTPVSAKACRGDEDGGYAAKTATLNKVGNPNSDRTLARLRSSTEKVNCVFNVTAPGAATIKAFDDAGAKLDLIAIADKRTATLQTSDDRSPIFDSTIPAGTYKNLQSAVKGAAVPTVTVDDLVVGNKDWTAKNPDEMKRIAAVKLN